MRVVLGTKDDNELEAVTIALGTVAAILLVNLPAALAIMVAVGVIANRIAEVRQLQVDVRTDPKTGLLNMRGWREVAEREMNRASRDDRPCALLMVDLDHFKNINDTWGHPAGDDVLQYVAHALRSATRPSDVIGRFGGEEFVLLLPDADRAEASAAGERIRQTISELHVPTTDKRGGPVAISHRTTSVGVAVYPTHAEGLDPLLQAADAAVYEAKEGGRNQVRLAG
jgi:diguanylate cyclase (GGDEF)-like protein